MAVDKGKDNEDETKWLLAISGLGLSLKFEEVSQVGL